ncbi:calmodulin-binding protein 25-like [Elaeis guineensis]|uniref:Calmodulin-binding protein 25-like n=1 Tax=Elaeis guineensis var. tenera TaxID=51953 RepID=A0A6I9Q815_ELAGV|nr:calmodulin-binding protein 25-like [Elaeis guineensis]
MSENCAAADSTYYRPPFPDSWISNTFARETEALTKALQISLSATDSLSSSSSSSFLLDLIKPEPTALAPYPDTGLKRAAPPATGRISKRKSRGSKRCPTTYINADPANFRQMVQQVTGVRVVDANLPVEPVSEPEPQRAGGSRSGLEPPQSCLPTLDTSAVLLDRTWVVGPETETLGSSGPAVDGPVGYELEPFPTFPTLESWGVM